jgi:hypothetical protein
MITNYFEDINVGNAARRNGITWSARCEQR